MPAGRPTSYHDTYPKQAEKLCALGATDADLADFFEVSIVTINAWKMKHPEFLKSLQIGKEPSDDRVERSLYQRAVGYTYDAEKIFNNPGAAPTRVQYREHVPPDVAACFIWLKNRRKETWRDRHETAVVGPGGGPVQTVEMTLDEFTRLAKQIASEV